METYKMYYTGVGYPSKSQIEEEAKNLGFTHSYWASEFGYNGFYNGDTVVVYNSTKDMPESMRKDANKYGREIK